MTGPNAPDDGPTLFGEPLAPDQVAGVDDLPLDEVTVTGKKVGSAGETYWYWRVAGWPESGVGYRDKGVARRKGAEHLRAERQKRAMRDG